MIKILTTGGTIDKVYFDAQSEFEVGEPQVAEILSEANVSIPYSIVSVIRKDSLDMTEFDREVLFKKVKSDESERIVITHGTDTMIQSASFLREIKNKTIVFTGSMQPARLKSSDAAFNVACAITAAQILNHGVYIAMNGQIFDPEKIRKNREKHRFELIP